MTKESYQIFAPAVYELIVEHGKLTILFEMHEFHGWTMGAMWEDMKFDYKHWHDIEKLAIVGESKWKAGMVALCKPFTSANIKYFDHEKLDDAQTRLAE